MARQGKVAPTHRPRDEEALLLRSAESLGRMIGALQRQLENLGVRASGRRAPAATNGHANGGRTGAALERPAGRAPARKSARNGAPKTTGRRESGAAKVGSTDDRKSKRAAKSAGARKSAGRRSGKRKAARK